MSGLSPSTVRRIFQFIDWWTRPYQPEPKPVVEARRRLDTARWRRNTQAVGRATFKVYVARHDALRQEISRKRAAK